MKTETTAVRQKLAELAQRIGSGDIGSAKLWGGADVVVATEQQPIETEGFYPSPRYVVAKSGRELSWLICELRDAFSGLYDSQSKIEFFGRLANSANRYQARRTGQEERQELLLAVLHEAFAILDDMEEGRFESLPLAMGSEILDDYVDEAQRRGFVGVEETASFFRSKGVEL